MKYLALILDDQPAEIRLLESVLKMRNFDSISAKTPEEATKMIEEYAPHLLFVDIMLGEHISGIDWLINFRKTQKMRIPAIVITSSKDADNVSKAIQADIDDFILKPADFNIFSKKIYKVAKYLEKKPLYSIQFYSKNISSFNIEMPASISSISEAGITISSFLANKEACEDVKVSTDFFQKIGISSPKQIEFLNKDNEKRMAQLGVPFRIYCQAKGWSEQDLVQLRKWIATKGLKRLY